MEPNSPKKIQFAVPLFQSHLDPQAAEHIRKRRPTPATLVIYNDPNASDDKQSASGQSETQLSPAQRKTSVYTPPTMRDYAERPTYLGCSRKNFVMKEETLGLAQEGRVGFQCIIAQWRYVAGKYAALVEILTPDKLQLVVEQHFQRHEQVEAGFSDSPDTPSPIAAQQPNGTPAPWANHSSTESYVSCDEQAGNSEMGGKDHSNKQRSGQMESPNLPRHTQSALDTLSEEPTDRDVVDQPGATGAMKRSEGQFSSSSPKEQETFPKDQDEQNE